MEKAFIKKLLTIERKVFKTTEFVHSHEVMTSLYAKYLCLRIHACDLVKLRAATPGVSDRACLSTQKSFFHHYLSENCKYTVYSASP